MKLKFTSRAPKRLNMELQPYMTKKQRTNRPRRTRSHISPILFSLNPITKCFSGDDVSCTSSGLTVDSNSVRKRKLSQIKDVPQFRQITRSRSNKVKEIGNEVEVSESSCVQSNAGVDAAFSEKAGEFSLKDNDSISDISKSDNFSFSESKSLGLESDLTCAEQFTYDDAVSEHSSSQQSAFSEIFMEYSSELDFSDYTPSVLLDSGSEFSEKSICDDSSPSPTYSLFLEFRRQFSRSTFPNDTRRSSLIETQTLRFSEFEDEDEEASYRRLRERERRQVFLHDHVELYSSTTKYGDLIFEQRLRMVNWIIEESAAKELQPQTMFLGISLLDRFLSKGYFNNKRNLQVVGIACLTLATRIEENQLYNIVRQKNFHVCSTLYSRFEVVAMEWLVLEVLNFQCFLPTIYNFMGFYLKVAKADEDFEKRVQYLAMLALSDHEQLQHWPSTVAAGLVILASVESGRINSYQQVMKIHARTQENDLHDCIKKLEWLLQNVN